MGKGEYNEGILAHELAHAFQLNFLHNGVNNAAVKKAWYASGGAARKRKGWTYAKSSWRYKRYMEAECAFKKLGKAPCKENGKTLVPYPMLNIREYFAVLFTAAYGLGDAGVEGVCKWDSYGCSVIRRIFSHHYGYEYERKYFITDNMDPRVVAKGRNKWNWK